MTSDKYIYIYMVVMICVLQGIIIACSQRNIGQVFKNRQIIQFVLAPGHYNVINTDAHDLYHLSSDLGREST